jgi:hypothetical protein
MEGSPPAPRRRTRAVKTPGADSDTAATQRSGPAKGPAAGGEAAATRPSPAVKPSAAAATNGDGAATSFLQRAPLRRRLRYLRRRRELALRDLGGFVFEAHRRGEQNPAALDEKLTALDAIDSERETLEGALGEHSEILVLREPGISTCANCATLHGSEARFCPACGQAVGASR